MPNNRQWASIFWITALAVFVLARRETRASTVNVLRAATSAKILVPLALLLGWVVGLAYVGSRVGIWGPDRVTDTVFWFVTAGLVLFGRFDKVSHEPHFVRRTTVATLELSALVEVLSELFVLTLAAELILQPAFGVLGGMSVVAAQKPEHRPAKRLVDGVIVVASALLLVYVTVSLVSNWESVDKADLLQQFALPVWFTIGVLPYIYLVGLLAAYELAFLRIGWRSKTGWWPRTRAKLVLLTSLHFKARDVGAFSGPWQLALASSTSFRDGRRVVRELRQAQRDAERDASERAMQLIRFAGVDGVDTDGRRLDRREFEETTATLRWVATCQMGWYNNNQAGRYRIDLLDFVLEGSAGRRLPNPHGVEMGVSGDGQKWFAWRRTVSGWVFAIGAAGPPPDQWEYDGPEPPSGFPGEDPTWGDRPFGMDVNRNW